MLNYYLQCSYAEGQFSLKEIGSSYSKSTSVALGFEILYLNDVMLQGRRVVDAQTGSQRAIISARWL